MKKVINMSFENCRVDGDNLWEEPSKEEPMQHSIKSIFAMLDGEEGLTITIKKSTRQGEIREESK